jgi:putative alpha-1,2-mannosidase
MVNCCCFKNYEKGFYPLYSGKSQLSVSIPMFSSIQITRETGHIIQILTHGVGSRVAKLLVDGVVVPSSLMELHTFTNATKIEFFLN